MIDGVARREAREVRKSDARTDPERPSAHYRNANEDTPELAGFAA